jgi:OHCU decarboxylase
LNEILARWNACAEDEAIAELRHCCVARDWAARVVAMRPFRDVEAVYQAADRAWAQASEADCLQAFGAHPRIGERKVEASAQSKTWSGEEQSAAEVADAQVMQALAAGNARYERSFGFTFIVCATGKSAEEMHAILQRRMANSREAELIEAAEEQRQILQIRLRKWLAI